MDHPERLVSFLQRMPPCDHDVLRDLLGPDRYDEVSRQAAEARARTGPTGTSDDELQLHVREVAEAIEDGQVVPFLGAGASVYARGRDVALRSPDDFLKEHIPTAGELAEHYLAALLDEDRPFPDAARRRELVLVAQWFRLHRGKALLNRRLHRIFNLNRDPTPLHRFLAELPRLLRGRYRSPTYPIYFTTNYDDLLSRAFVDAGEPFDVLVYLAEGKDIVSKQDLTGKFRHYTFAVDRATQQVRRLGADDVEPGSRAPGRGRVRGDRVVVSLSGQDGAGAVETDFGLGEVIMNPSEYMGPSLEERPVIVKIHGTVDRRPPGEANFDDSYVITEDDYIEFLPRTHVASLFPRELVERLDQRRFLFLGYSLRDWNLRAILRRLQSLNDFRSWAVQLAPDELERSFWEDRDVDILDVPLDRYVPALTEATRRRFEPEDEA